MPSLEFTYNLSLDQRSKPRIEIAKLHYFTEMLRARIFPAENGQCGSCAFVQAGPLSNFAKITVREMTTIGGSSRARHF